MRYERMKITHSNSAKREVWVKGQETTDVKACSLPLKD